MSLCKRAWSHDQKKEGQKIYMRTKCPPKAGIRAQGPRPAPQGTPWDPALGPGTPPKVSRWPVSGAGPESIWSRVCEIPGSPGRPLTQIYPLRARRRPRRVRGSRFVSLCMCLSVCVFLHVFFMCLLVPLTGSGSRPGIRENSLKGLSFSTILSHRFFEGLFEGFGIDFG